MDARLSKCHHGHLQKPDLCPSLSCNALAKVATSVLLVPFDIWVGLIPIHHKSDFQYN